MPTRFPVALDLPVLWGDMDALGHVNNTLYFRHFESARMEYFRQTGIWDTYARTKIGPILASTTCQFRHPVRFPDTVRVHTGVSELRHTSFTMQYRTTCGGGATLAAEGSGVIVMYDYERGEKTPIPAALRAAIEAFERDAGGAPTGS